MAKVRLRPKARTDIEDIWLYGVKRWGLDQADSYLNELNTIFQLISENPQIAKPRHELNPPVRIHPHSSHAIVYEINDGLIDVVRVLHQNMLLSHQLS